MSAHISDEYVFAFNIPIRDSRDPAVAENRVTGLKLIDARLLFIDNLPKSI